MMSAMSEPRIAIGHYKLSVTDVARSAEFYVALGMIETHPRSQGMAILELRGGTHFLLFRAKRKPKPVRLPFDFLVEDVDALQKELKGRGLFVGPMMRDRFGPHRSFTSMDLDGHELAFTSEH
jgi:hypothetical protein